MRQAWLQENEHSWVRTTEKPPIPRDALVLRGAGGPSGEEMLQVSPGCEGQLPGWFLKLSHPSPIFIISPVDKECVLCSPQQEAA